VQRAIHAWYKKQIRVTNSPRCSTGKARKKVRSLYLFWE